VRPQLKSVPQLSHMEPPLGVSLPLRGTHDLGFGRRQSGGIGRARDYLFRFRAVRVNGKAACHAHGTRKTPMLHWDSSRETLFGSSGSSLAALGAPFPFVHILQGWEGALQRLGSPGVARDHYDRNAPICDSFFGGNTRSFGDSSAVVCSKTSAI
jgi:hypothetical protein